VNRERGIFPRSTHIPSLGNFKTTFRCMGLHFGDLNIYLVYHSEVKICYLIVRNDNVIPEDNITSLYLWIYSSDASLHHKMMGYRKDSS
jgi:hypothetical protein